MRVDTSDQLRNVAIVGHKDSGKTTLASALLYCSGITGRLQEIEQGNTITDFDPEEVARSMSIGLAPCWLPWRKHKINVLDCPGSGIFLAESRAGIMAADATLLNVNAGSGIEVATEKAWGYADEYGSPVLFNITKLDRDNTDAEALVEAIQNRFSRSAIPIQYPVGREGEFAAIVDLVSGKAYSFDEAGKCQGHELSAEDQEAADDWRATLMEFVAESDEDLMESYFEAGELDEDQIRSGLRAATAARELFPVCFTAAVKGVGVGTLLDSIIDVLPSPNERPAFPTVGGEPIATDNGRTCALVYKTLSDPFSGKISLFRVVSGEINSDTTYQDLNVDAEERLGPVLTMQGKQGEKTDKLIAGDFGGVAKLKHTATGHTLADKSFEHPIDWIHVREPAIAFAIEPKAKGDEEKIGEACHRLVDEDPTLRAGRDPQTGEFLLSGTGQLHVEIAVAKLKSRYKVEVVLHPPKVPYRETIKRTAEGHGRHKKQSGGRGQFADCKITMEPLPRGAEFEFVDEIFGGSIPQGYRPAVEKGIQETAARGYLAGFPVVEFRVRLQDGQYHDVDSSEMAFKVAGSLAFKDAMEKAGATILEPAMDVEISTSEEFMGDIMSDLSQRRGKPQGMETRDGDVQIVKAIVPMAEMLNYESALRSMTQGRSNFTMEFSHYEEVPKNVQQKIIAEAQAGEDA